MKNGTAQTKIVFCCNDEISAEEAAEPELSAQPQGETNPSSGDFAAFLRFFGTARERFTDFWAASALHKTAVCGTAAVVLAGIVTAVVFASYSPIQSATAAAVSGRPPAAGGGGTAVVSDVSQSSSAVSSDVSSSSAPASSASPQTSSSASSSKPAAQQTGPSSKTGNQGDGGTTTPSPTPKPSPTPEPTPTPTVNRKMTDSIDSSSSSQHQLTITLTGYSNPSVSFTITDTPGTLYWGASSRISFLTGTKNITLSGSTFRFVYDPGYLYSGSAFFVATRDGDTDVSTKLIPLS